MPLYLEAFVKVMLPLGISKSDAISSCLASLGTPVELQARNLLAKFGKKISEADFQKIIADFWKACAGKPIKIFPGVKKTLDDLKLQGISLLASSGSKTEELARSFEKFQLSFDFFLGSDKVPKGDKHVDKFADHFSSPKADFCRRAAFVGDGTTDMEIAVRNAIFGVGITNSLPAARLKEAGAKSVISKFNDLTSFFNCKNSTSID
jgi:phosphoglycolate phosphatase-like HAD superfamily hydrolase